jgi:hypothetical protein
VKRSQIRQQEVLSVPPITAQFTKKRGRTHPPPCVHGIRVIAQGYDLVGLYMMVVGVLVYVVHEQLRHLADHL